MKIENANDLLGTWAVKKYIKKNGTLKVYRKPRGLKFIFNRDGSADMKVLFFTFHLHWALKEDKLILYPATEGKPPIEFDITEDGLVWSNREGQRTWFAKAL